MNTSLHLAGKRINMAPQFHRRLLVTLCYLAFGLFVVGFAFQSPFSRIATGVIGALSILVFAGFAGTGYENGDERQLHRRDHAFYVAHRKMGWVLVIALFTSWFQWPQNILLLGAGAELRRVLEQLPFMVLNSLIVLYATLPQAILLWTEPDIEEEER